jgi:hypothetical protein
MQFGYNPCFGLDRVNASFAHRKLLRSHTNRVTLFVEELDSGLMEIFHIGYTKEMHPGAMVHERDSLVLETWTPNRCGRQ